MAVTKRLRFEILRRDGHTCRYCGDRSPDVQLRLDHVVPRALGGSDDPSNLVTACEPCNTGKASIAPDSPLVDDVKQAALRWRAAMLEAELQIASDRLNSDALRATVEAEWAGWMCRQPVDLLPLDFVLSIEQWDRAGLRSHVIPRLVEVVMVRDVTDQWSYFCGVVWRYLDEVRERALDVADTDPATWLSTPSTF